MSVVLAILMAFTGPAAAECLEVGWRDARQAWVYYRAYVTEMNQSSGRVRLRYDFKNGELDLKIYEKETPSGRDRVVMRGRWFERGGRSGKVRLEMEKGRHRARGYYTHAGNDARYDFVLRECRNAAPPPSRWHVGDAIQVLWKGKWYNSRIIRVDGSRYRISYDGWSSSWDEWVTESRMRRRR